MTDIPHAELFAEYAGGDPHKWAALLNWPVFHQTFGHGIVVEIESRPGQAPLIQVQFRGLVSGAPTKYFDPTAFTRGFITLESLPGRPDLFIETRQKIEARLRAEQEVAEQLRREAAEAQTRKEAEERQRQQEVESARQFLALQEKYQVKGFHYESPASPLFPVLLKLEAREKFSKNDCEWLEQKHLYFILAIYHEQRYLDEKSLWDVARAGKYWRLAGQPQRALEIQCDLATEDRQALAAVLTNRGAALRDLGQIEAAHKFTLLALEQSQDSYHAYNLLGSINFQIGDIEKGEACFARAIELGATPLSQEEALKTAIRLSPEEGRQRTAQYLLNKDAQKYAWARHYLKKVLIK